MPANTVPIFTLTPNIAFANLLAVNANTALDGTGTVSTVFTAGADGSMVNSIIVKSNTTTATSAAGTLRIWINNGAVTSTATNNTLVREYVLTANTANATSATLNYEFPLNFQLPAGFRIICTVATMAASTSWQFTCLGANY
ncbi:MAG: hypothetical protein ACRC1W_12255 [Shewanella sp.]